jgi:hypothetical protein
MSYLVKSRRYVRTGRRPARVPFIEIVARCGVFEEAIAAAAQYSDDLGCDKDSVWVEGPRPLPQASEESK